MKTEVFLVIDLTIEGFVGKTGGAGGGHLEPILL